MVSNQLLIGRALSLLRQYNSLFDLLALIAMFVAGLGVINTLTMSVTESAQEIGNPRSIGLTRIFLLGMTATSGYKMTLMTSTTPIPAGSCSLW